MQPWRIGGVLNGRGQSRANRRRLRLALLLLCFALVLWAAPGLADEIIGAKTSKIYHTHSEACSSAKRILPENRTRFASVKEAEQSGRRLCKHCADLDAKAAEEDRSGGESVQPKKPSGKPKDARASKPGPTTEPADSDNLGEDAAFPLIARVTNVLPSGTLELDVDEKARLLGVVCPSADQPYAKDAVRFLTEQTQDRTVRLSFDSSTSGVPLRDALGRLLVYSAPKPDWRDLGGELIFQGYAWVDREANFGRRAEYARREEEAWRAKRGIWKPLEHDEGRRKVVAGRHAHHYHHPDCPHVADLIGKMTLTINEAKERRLPPCPLWRND